MAPNTRRILIVLGIALLLRVLLPLASAIAVGGQKGLLLPDSGSYLRPAEQMLRAGRFASGEQPEVRRTPGYPLLLIPGILLGSPVLVTIALQVLLGLATVWLVYKTTQLLFGDEDAAAAAALLYALEPLSILYSALILAETLFTALLVASFFCLAEYFRRGQSLLALILAAAALAASIFVRPVSYYLPFPIALVLAVALLLRHRKAVYLLHAAVFLVVSFAPLAAWQARNRARAGFDGFSAISSVNLYFCQAASIRAKLEGLPYQEVRRRMGSGEEHPEQLGWDDNRRYAFWKSEGLRLVKEHPVLYAGIHLQGLMRVLFEPGALDYLKVFGAAPRSSGTLGRIVDRGLASVVLGLLRDNPLVFWTQLALFVLLAAYYLLAALGLFGRQCPGFLAKAALVAVILYFLAISGGPQGYSRFRHPVMPLLCVLAGCGLHRLARKRESSN